MVAGAVPALALNYMGQGAMLLEDPEAINNPFYNLVPKAWVIPLVVLATVALKGVSFIREVKERADAEL